MPGDSSWEILDPASPDPGSKIQDAHKLFLRNLGSWIHGIHGSNIPGPRTPGNCQTWERQVQTWERQLQTWVGRGGGNKMPQCLKCKNVWKKTLRTAKSSEKVGLWGDHPCIYIYIRWNPWNIQGNCAFLFNKVIGIILKHSDPSETLAGRLPRDETC